MTTSVTTRAAGTLNPTRQQLDELDALLQRMLQLPVHPLEKPEQAQAEEPPPPPRKAEGAKKKVEKEAPAPSPNTFRVAASSLPSVSYTVVETASARPLPPASGFEPRPSMLTPRLVPVSPPAEPPAAPPPPVADAGEGQMWVPLRSTWKPSASTWGPLAESWHQANNGASPLAAPSPVAESPPEPTPPLPAEPAIAVQKPAPLPISETVIEIPRAEPPAAIEPQPSRTVSDSPGTVAWPLLPLVWFNQGFDACVAPLGAPGRWLCGRGRVVLGFLGLACLAAAAAIAANAGMGWSH